VRTPQRKIVFVCEQLRPVRAVGQRIEQVIPGTADVAHRHIVNAPDHGQLIGRVQRFPAPGIQCLGQAAHHVIVSASAGQSFQTRHGAVFQMRHGPHGADHASAAELEQGRRSVQRIEVSQARNQQVLRQLRHAWQCDANRHSSCHGCKADAAGDKFAQGNRERDDIEEQAEYAQCAFLRTVRLQVFETAPERNKALEGMNPVRLRCLVRSGFSPGVAAQRLLVDIEQLRRDEWAICAVRGEVKLRFGELS
jgi:hypothetical protein